MGTAILSPPKYVKQGHRERESELHLSLTQVLPESLLRFLSDVIL